MKYVVSRTDLNTKLLSEHIGKDFALKETFPPWTLFELPHADTKPISLEYEPVLTFTSLRAKDRPPEGLEAYDWLRLNEEWFLNADFRYVLARPEDIFLDDAPDLRHFKIALLTQYEYIDETRAFYTVSHFAREHYVLLLESPDPLYRRLTHDTSIPKDHILTIPRTGDPRKDFKVILARLDGLHLKTNTTRWELMKTAFFPTYRRAGDAPVYLASPALTLRTHF